MSSDELMAAGARKMTCVSHGFRLTVFQRVAVGELVVLTSVNESVVDYGLVTHVRLAPQGARELRLREATTADLLELACR